MQRQIFPLKVSRLGVAGKRVSQEPICHSRELVRADCDSLFTNPESAAGSISTLP